MRLDVHILVEQFTCILVYSINSVQVGNKPRSLTAHDQLLADAGKQQICVLTACRIEHTQDNTAEPF